jgi:hypothetical protein
LPLGKERLEQQNLNIEVLIMGITFFDAYTHTAGFTREMCKIHAPIQLGQLFVARIMRVHFLCPLGVMGIRDNAAQIYNTQADKSKIQAAN